MFVSPGRLRNNLLYYYHDHVLSERTPLLTTRRLIYTHVPESSPSTKPRRCCHCPWKELDLAMATDTSHDSVALGQHKNSHRRFSPTCQGQSGNRIPPEGVCQSPNSPCSRGTGRGRGGGARRRGGCCPPPANRPCLLQGPALSRHRAPKWQPGPTPSQTLQAKRARPGRGEHRPISRAEPTKLEPLEAERPWCWVGGWGTGERRVGGRERPGAGRT